MVRAGVDEEYIEIIGNLVKNSTSVYNGLDENRMRTFELRQQLLLAEETLAKRIKEGDDSETEFFQKQYYAVQDNIEDLYRIFDQVETKKLKVSEAELDESQVKAKSLA